MKKTIRCCISCILPCGVLDVVRIVHANGRVDELAGVVTAGEFLKTYPKHVLKRPSSSASEDGVVPKIVVVPLEAELQKGKIYFLMPAPPEKISSTGGAGKKKKIKRDTSSSRSRAPPPRHHHHNNNNDDDKNDVVLDKNVVVSDMYLSEILSEKASPAADRDRRRGRVAVWRPMLESISETPSEVLNM